MSSQRLVVLDEQDYKALLNRSKFPEPAPPTTSEPTPEPPKTPEPTSEPPKVPEPEPPKTPEPRPEPKEPTPDLDKSPLEELVAKIPKSGQRKALNLLDRLSKLDSFGYDVETGEIKLDGNPLKNYTLEKFLVATCKKSAPNTLPVPLRIFLRKHKFRNFHNPNIRLGPTAPWRSQYGSTASTTRRGT